MCLGPTGESFHDTLLGIWLTVLTHEGVSLAISDPLRDALNAANPLGDVLRVLVSFTQMRVFLNFQVYS